MSKIIVIGANHAGTAAINTVLDNYPENELVIFDANSNISFLGCGMALWIGQQIDGPDGLFYASKEEFESKGATVHMETAVTSIDYDNKIVHGVDKNGNRIDESFDKLIMATGSLPIIPNIEGRNLENVQMVKMYQNAEEVINKLEDESLQNIVVVGGGYIGVELAEAFKRLNKNVTIIDSADSCLTNYYDKDFRALMNKRLADHGINLEFNQMVQKLEGDTKVQKVITNKGEYDADMVILAVGFKPNNELGKDDLALFKNGAFIVDKTYKTSNDDVYAIGDCATIYDNARQQDTYIALATNAVRSGIVAAHNACGNKIESLGVQGSNGICIFDLKMVSTGLSEEKAIKEGYKVKSVFIDDLQKPAFIKHNNDSVMLKIVYDEETRRILGAQMASEYDISMGIHMFSLAIQEQLTIDHIALLDLFFLPHFNQPYNYISKAALSTIKKA